MAIAGAFRFLSTQAAGRKHKARANMNQTKCEDLMIETLYKTIGAHHHRVPFQKQVLLLFIKVE